MSIDRIAERHIGTCAGEPETKYATVLFVTADRDLREVVARVLDRAGFDIVTAAHAGHALLAGLTFGRIDVLVTDVKLDDMPGAALADSLRRYHVGMRTVFMTDVGGQRRAGQMVRPFTREDLLAELDALTPAATWRVS